MNIITMHMMHLQMRLLGKTNLIYKGHSRSPFLINDSLDLIAHPNKQVLILGGKDIIFGVIFH